MVGTGVTDTATPGASRGASRKPSCLQACIGLRHARGCLALPDYEAIKTRGLAAVAVI